MKTLVTVNFVWMSFDHFHGKVTVKRRLTVYVCKLSVLISRPKFPFDEFCVLVHSITLGRRDGGGLPTTPEVLSRILSSYTQKNLVEKFFMTSSGRQFSRFVVIMYFNPNYLT